MRQLFFSFLLIYGAACYAQVPIATNNSSHADNSNNACMENAHRLLDEAFVLMQRNYYRKEYINWDTLRAAAKQKLQSRSFCNDAYETINWCFEQMREKHSFIMPTIKAAEYNNDWVQLSESVPISKLVGTIKGEWLEDSIAYISIPWVSTTDEAICTKIADSIQQLIRHLDARVISKWIIDLRNNSGGNCWPMITGVGPLIGEGVCGYFVRNHERVAISYKNGASYQGKVLRCKTSGTPYQLKSSAINIVILTNNGTSSSGEIVALAFKGKENVRFAGEATAGYTTANATYNLSDKSMLVLTVCQEADRTGKIYSGRLIPDLPVAFEPGKGDIIKENAIRWLSQR
jgi:C-terminal processing protease CtpA/Prc